MQYNSKILITGGSGFIGKNLIEGLGKKYSIYSPSSKDLDLLNTELVEKYLKTKKFDFIIHCATHNATQTSTKDLSLVFYSNLKMFFNLARCERYYNRMFYFGSGAEYDMRNYIPKMKEDYFDTYVPVDDYGFSKYIMAKYTERSKKIIDLRLFGCFGKYEDYRIRFISNAICKCIFNIDVSMFKNVFFDYLYINDLVSIMDMLLKKRRFKYKFYNVTTGVSIDLLSLAKLIVKISGKNLQIKIAQKGIKKEYSGDNSRLLNEIGKFNFTPIEKSITELFKWYQANRKNLEKTALI